MLNILIIALVSFLLAASTALYMLRFDPKIISFVWESSWFPYFARYFRGEKPFDKNHVVARFFNKRPIVVHKDDNCVCKMIRTCGWWERHNTRALLPLIHKGDVVVEVGANYGWYTILMAEAVGKMGKVYSYEANPDVFAPLQETLKLNADLKNIVAKNIAISDHAYTGYLVYGLENIGSGFILTPEQLPETFKSDDNRIRPIEVTTLDQELPNITANFLRMDIEGAEYFALKGGKELIARSRALILAIEWGEEHLKRIGVNENDFIAFLKEENFIPYHLHKSSLIQVPYDFLVNRGLCDMVFSRQPLL